MASFFWLLGKIIHPIIDDHNFIFDNYWKTNAILIEPVQDAKDESVVKVFNNLCKYLKKKGFAPKFNIMDNMASHSIKKILKSKHIGVQLVEPNNHHVNAVECAI